MVGCMRRLIFLKVAGKDVHLPKLVGALILTVAVLMFVKASADMFDSWDNMKAFESCMGSVGKCDTTPADDIWTVQDPCQENEWQDDYDACRYDLYDATGTFLRSGQTKLTSRQFWSGLLAPIAGFFFWLAMLFVGWVLYKSGQLVLPIEETVRILGEKKGKKRGK